jgi:SAM-dependent methyltransferase
MRHAVPRKDGDRNLPLAQFPFAQFPLAQFLWHNRRMSQNIYDQPDFFAGYSSLRRSVEGLDGAPEWPALRAMLPPLKGLRVADLGCGFGWFCRWAAEQGAAEVVGFDLSERMLEQARDASPPSIGYERADLAKLSLPAAAFDLIYSSLALHYLPDIVPLLATVHAAIVPGGRFVFSTEHPIFSAPSRPGWSADAGGNRTWPIDRYLIEGVRTTNWFFPGVVKYHRTIGTTLTALLRAGFRLTHVEEFCPTAEQIAARPELEQERDRPMFLMVASVRDA